MIKYLVNLPPSSLTCPKRESISEKKSSESENLRNRLGGFLSLENFVQILKSFK